MPSMMRMPHASWTASQVPFGNVSPADTHARSVVSRAAPRLGTIARYAVGAVARTVMTTVMSAYRGAGRPEAASLIERAMDMLAAELGIDPAELRRRNMIAGPFPYTTATEVTYDSGDYRRALEMALEAAGYDDLRREQKGRRDRNSQLQLGIGIGAYVEMTAVPPPSESAAARVDRDGTIVISVGTTSSGQGHETAYAQVAAAVLGVPMEGIRVVQSD